MMHVLSNPGLEMLDRLAGSQVVLGFDYDGTLAPLVDDPARATMQPETAALLGAVARLYPCVVISGRSRASVGRLLNGLSLACTVGSHGLECNSDSVVPTEQAAGWFEGLQRELASLPGVRVERKPASVTVHYRLSPQPLEALAVIRRTVNRLTGVRRIYSKDAVDVLPEDPRNKGTALRDILCQLGCCQALYVGDDATDEDVFELEVGGHVVGVRVGRHADTAASWYLKNQLEVDVLLGFLRDRRTFPKRRLEG